MLGCALTPLANAGRVWINGVHTIKITGTPVQDRLPKGMVQATKAGIRFTVYVDPATRAFRCRVGRARRPHTAVERPDSPTRP